MTAAILALILTASINLNTPYVYGFRVVSSIQSGEIDSLGIQWRHSF